MTVSVPDVREQKRLITEAEKKYNDLKAGEKWYAVSTKWWENWEALGHGTDPKSLGRIDNSDLYDEKLRGLKEEAQENLDYVLKNEQVWKNLAAWYNASKAISGDVVLNKSGQPIIDLHPARFEVHIFDAESDENEGSGGENSDDGDEKAPTENESGQPSQPNEDQNSDEKQVLVVSRYKLMKDLRGTAAKKFDLNENEIKLFLRSPEQDNWTLLDDTDDKDMEQTIGEALPKIGIEQWQLKINKLSTEHIVEKEFSVTSPEVGQVLDVKHKSGKFLEGKVVKVSKEGSRVTVHFLSFDSKDDIEFDVKSEDLCPPYSKVPDWRMQLRVGEEVEIHQRVFGDKSYRSPWVTAEVKKIDRSAKVLKNEAQNAEDESAVSSMFSKLKFSSRKSNPKTKELPKIISKHGLVKVRYYTGSGGWLSRQYKDVVLDLGSEDIAQQYTHLKKPAKRGYGPKSIASTPDNHGVVGLKNLGNTCYMNSSLQCLIATRELSNHFTSGEYLHDINRKNPIGFGGKVADAYGKLVNNVFSDEYSVIAPRAFKNVAASLQSQAFAGYAQHDAHEFTVALLDGLHEDLNRIKQKPYVEAVESEGKPDSEVAALSWEGFKKRNESIVVDTMYGQLRSHLTCPDCGNEATKFDPFACWSVPLPISEDVHLHIVVITKDGSSRTRYLMETHNGVKGSTVAEWVSEKSGIPMQNLYLTGIRMNKFDQAYYKPDMKKVVGIVIRDNGMKELVAHELEDIAEVDDEGVRETSPTEANTANNVDSSDGEYAEETDEEIPEANYIEVQFKVDAKNQYRAVRISSVVRFMSMTNQKLHEIIWERISFMFEDKDFADSTDLYKVVYADKVVPADEELFVKSTKYYGNRMEVKIKKAGIEALIPDVKDEVSPNMYYKASLSVDDMNENMNIGEIVIDKSVKSAIKKKEEEITLEKCFEKFQKEEKLGKDDMWYCGKCKDFVQATKKMDLYQTGDILCIHLKRFKREKFRNIKLSNHVEFPLENFVINDYLAGDADTPQVFDLYGIVHHMGSANGGHYIADIKTDKGWFNMNDSSTRKISDENLKNKLVRSSAYMLYYKKRKE
mmetsp:Transcript_12448/g.14305  ORF Transcript_12448/g.14305 Transcript_12448/m.14305 type:complete len:1077 (+) Transcript_12448:96-3326(+)